MVVICGRGENYGRGKDRNFCKNENLVPEEVSKTFKILNFYFFETDVNCTLLPLVPLMTIEKRADQKKIFLIDVVLWCGACL